ncbi:hypothetical protein [Demequina sp. NBRC 110052]|uniref:hypothetical protein n=1 Tax=Demequina sp. NBRC 110052 TaxID=1570341 RepID=UPI0009FEF0C2|nr:hypothetical protein [Demequina sp. NBRC 110052]
MSGALRVEGDDLTHAARDMRTVVTGFSREDARAGAAADHVGHAGLAQEIQGFACAWIITRDRIATHLAALSDYLDATAETFADMDRQLADELTRASS